MNLRVTQQPLACFVLCVLDAWCVSSALLGSRAFERPWRWRRSSVATSISGCSSKAGFQHHFCPWFCCCCSCPSRFISWPACGLWRAMLKVAGWWPKACTTHHLSSNMWEVSSGPCPGYQHRHWDPTSNSTPPLSAGSPSWPPSYLFASPPSSSQSQPEIAWVCDILWRQCATIAIKDYQGLQKVELVNDCNHRYIYIYNISPIIGTYDIYIYIWYHKQEYVSHVILCLMVFVWHCPMTARSASCHGAEGTGSDTSQTFWEHPLQYFPCPLWFHVPMCAQMMKDSLLAFASWSCNLL